MPVFSRSLILIAGAAVLLGSVEFAAAQEAVAEAGGGGSAPSPPPPPPPAAGHAHGDEHERGQTHSFNGAEVFWQSDLHPCPEDCGRDAFTQIRSVVCYSASTNNLTSDDNCDPALRLPDSRECPNTEPCPPPAIEAMALFNDTTTTGFPWFAPSSAICDPATGTFTHSWAPTYPFGLAFHAGVSANWACPWTAGDESSCTGIGCTYTAPAAEVAEACVDTDGSGDDCSGFTAGDSASCGSCDYTAPVAAAAEACTPPPYARDWEITASDTWTSDEAEVTLTGPMFYDPVLYVDPETGATAYMAHWSYFYYHTMPGRSTTTAVGHDHQGSGTCYVPNSIVVGDFSHDGPDTIVEANKETWGEFEVSTLAEWLDISPAALAVNPQGVWREVESGGQVEQGHLIRLRFWVEDATGTMGVFVNEMDMAVGSEDLTLVRDGQGYMESWGSFTQAVRNGFGDEMDSSAVELLVAHDLNGGTAAITTRMTVTHEKEAHEPWLNPLGLNLGGRRLQQADDETVETTFEFTVGGASAEPASEPQPETEPEAEPSSPPPPPPPTPPSPTPAPEVQSGCLAGAESGHSCAVAHETPPPPQPEVAIVGGSMSFAATMAEIEEDRPAFETDFKGKIVDQYRTAGVTITSDNVLVTEIEHARRRRLQEGSSGVVVSYVVQVPCDGDCTATTTAAEAANTQTLEAAEAGDLTVGTFVSQATPPPPPPPPPETTTTPSPSPHAEDNSHQIEENEAAIHALTADVQSHSQRIDGLGQDIADNSLANRANAAAAEAVAQTAASIAEDVSANAGDVTALQIALAAAQTELAAARARLDVFESADDPHTATLAGLRATNTDLEQRLASLEAAGSPAPPPAEGSSIGATAVISGVISAIVAAILFFASSKCRRNRNLEPAQNGRERKFPEEGGTPILDLEEGTPDARTPRPTTPDRSGPSGGRRQQMATTPPRGA